MPTQSTYRPFYQTLTLLTLAVLALSIVMPSAVRSAQNSAQAKVAATESTLVSSNDPTTNFNGSPLEVAYSNFPSFSPVRRVLVKFDLSTLTQALTTTPFQITVTSTSLDGASINVGLYTLPDTWAANTVTSDTQPAVGTLLETKSVANGFTGALRFDAAAVGAYLEGERTGDKTASFLLRIDGGATLLFGGNMIFDTPIIDAPTTPTPTATNTTVPPTATATNTTVPPTATATNTGVPPTATATNTGVLPTATATNTTVPPTATATNTTVPTVTPTGTALPPTATATNTTVPTVPTVPTVTPTGTALPPTATATSTTMPTVPTVTPTGTALPPTATVTNTPTPTATPTLPTGDEIVVIEPDQEAIINWPNPDGSVINIVFPAGVVDEEITIIFNSLPAPSSAPNGFSFAGIAFTLDAYRNNILLGDFNFRNQGIQVTLTYTDAAIAGLDEDDLMLYYFDEATGTWKTDGITLVSHDKANNRIVFNLTHLTEFALFAPAGGTVTPTPTPTDDGDDDDGGGDDGTSEEGFDPIGGSLVGNYCLATGGIGLRANPNGAFAVNVVGTPVHAYLVWVGRYPDNSPDNDIQVSIHGGLPITVVAADDRQSELPGGVSYFTFLSMNLVNNPSFAGLLTGALNITVSGLNSGNAPGNEGYGVGLLIVSSGPTCPIGQIDLAYGLDSFFDDGTVSAAAVTALMAPQGSLGPNSAVPCVEFPAADASRTMNIQSFVGGVDPSQTNALWYATGAGAPPTELIANSAGMVFDGPPVTVASPFTSNLGPQLDNYTNSIVVPAGATFACFQIESAPTSDSAATDAVWISFTSQLHDAGVAPTATPTPLHTPTPTNTPIPTLTGIPTLPPIPTATATGVSTPTPTPTSTPGGAPGLSIDIAVEPLVPAPGDDVFFTLSYMNSGAVSAPNVKFTFTVPANTTFKSAASTAGWLCTGTGPGSRCEFSLGDVDPGESGKVRFVVTVDPNLGSASHQIGLNLRLVNGTGAILSEKAVLLLVNAPFRFFVPLSTR